MSALSSLEWSEVRAHYEYRQDIHTRLLRLHRARNTIPFANLVLGISDAAGNYSAAEHGLGPQILRANVNAADRVYRLAGELISLRSARDVPPLIRQAGLRFLQIGVGSEASCILNPEVCWVANTRTIWTHLVIKHADNFSLANEELRYYRDAEATSEMAYSAWVAIHAELATSMTRIAEEGQRLALAAHAEPGRIKYLWAGCYRERSLRAVPWLSGIAGPSPASLRSAPSPAMRERG